MAFQFSCADEHSHHDCEFTFKEIEYVGETASCTDDPGPPPPFSPPGIFLASTGPWGKLRIETNSNYIRFETPDTSPYYYEGDDGTIFRSGSITLEFQATLTMDVEGVLSTGMIEGKCQCKY